MLNDLNQPKNEFADSGLSVRARRTITFVGAKTIDELTTKTSSQLLQRKQSGQKTLVEIKAWLAERNRQLADSQ